MENIKGTSAPPMKDLTIENITENTIRINSQGPDARLTYVLERLVNHLHDFARETRLSTKEWKAAIEFLTNVGKISSDVRQVSIPLSISHSSMSDLISLGVYSTLRHPRLVSPRRFH